MEPTDLLPAIPEALLKHLEETFPDRCPSISVPDREVWAATGRAEVVRYLRNLMERQHEEGSL
jgi:hypothetical protein